MAGGCVDEVEVEVEVEVEMELWWDKVRWVCEEMRVESSRFRRPADLNRLAALTLPLGGSECAESDPGDRLREGEGCGPSPPLPLPALRLSLSPSV